MENFEKKRFDNLFHFFSRKFPEIVQFENIISGISSPNYITYIFKRKIKCPIFELLRTSGLEKFSLCPIVFATCPASAIGFLLHSVNRRTR